MSGIKEKAKKDIKYMFSQLYTIDIDKITTDGITIRAGNKLLKLTTTEEKTLSIEDEVREEFRQKLSSKLLLIKENINAKISEMSDFVDAIKRDYNKKERELRKKIENAALMPEDMTYRHFKQGLTIAKDRNGIIYYCMNGLYWPRFVDNEMIEPSFADKMITHILIVIKTSNDSILEVTTRQPFNRLSYFDHYHQARPDCWGKWKPPKKFKTTDDIIKIAQEVQIVLEQINTNSIATENPEGLPRKRTLMRHLIPKEKGIEKSVNLRDDLRRMGATERNTERFNEDIWAT